MQKIKILHIIKSLGRGGAEMLLPETLKLHNKDKFEFYYIYFLPWKDQMVEAIKGEEGRVSCLSASNNLQLLKKSSEVVSFCRKKKIDVIHCHLPWSGFVGRVVFKRTGIPLIYTEHNIQEKYHFATRFLNKISFNHQSRAIGVSRDVTRSIKENIQPKIPVETVLNGVNTEKFKRDETKGARVRREYGIPHNAVVVGNLAVFRKQKGLEAWIKAFKILSESNQNVYGLLVGAGPEEDQIKALVEENGLNDRLKLPGLQTDTVAFFSAMDIFMMSSLFEGLPVALLESMSMGCAVVSTKAGGVMEAVVHEKDGLLCEVGDWRNLASLTLSLLENDQKRSRLQEAAREKVKREFSLKVMVNSLEDIYLKYV